MDNARLLVFEAYCRIHQCIDLRMLAAKLNMDESAAEKWVVNLIRNADLNAKIDSQVRLISSMPAVYWYGQVSMSVLLMSSIICRGQSSRS